MCVWGVPQHTLHRKELEGHGFGARRLDTREVQVVVMLFYLVESKQYSKRLSRKGYKIPRKKKLQLNRQRVASCMKVMTHMILSRKEKATEQLAGHTSAQSLDLMNLVAKAPLPLP